MQVFSLVLNQMAMMATLIIVGIILRKTGIVPENTGAALSKLETFVFLPALNFYNQVKNCTVENFTENSKLIVYGLVICAAAVLISYPLSKLFVRNYKESDALAYQRNLYKYGLTFGNFGYIGNFVVLEVFGEEAFFRFTMFCIFINIICYAWGLYILIPKVGAKSSILMNLKTGLLTPPTLSILFGITCGLLNVRQYMPEFFTKALDSAGNCMGPIAMLLAGAVIGGYELKKLLCGKKVYLLSFMRLVLIPAVLVLVLRLIGTAEDIIVLAFFAFAVPLGMNSIVYPAAYGGDTKLGASMVIISSALSVITIPAMYYLLIELL